MRVWFGDGSGVEVASANMVVVVVVVWDGGLGRGESRVQKCFKEYMRCIPIHIHTRTRTHAGITLHADACRHMLPIWLDSDPSLSESLLHTRGHTRTHTHARTHTQGTHRAQTHARITHAQGMHMHACALTHTGQATDARLPVGLIQFHLCLNLLAILMQE